MPAFFFCYCALLTRFAKNPELSEIPQLQTLLLVRTRNQHSTKWRLWSRREMRFARTTTSACRRIRAEIALNDDDDDDAVAPAAGSVLGCPYSSAWLVQSARDEQCKFAKPLALLVRIFGPDSACGLRLGCTEQLIG